MNPASASFPRRDDGTSPGEGILYSIQALRAVAAFLVCLAHTLIETDAFPGHGALPAFGKNGPLPAGVDLFFIISGFIMFYTSRRGFAQAGAARDFLIRRLTRIVPLYWLFTTLMILATLLVPDRLTKTMFDPWWAIRSFLFIPAISPRGEVGPILALGWSLEYEMYFYLLFSFSLTCRENRGLVILGITLGGIWAVARLLPLREIGLVRFLANPVVFEFLLGVAFARCWLDAKGSWRLAMYSCWSIGTLFAYLVLGPLVDHRLVQWGLPCLFGFVIVMAAADLFGSRWFRPLHLLGDASYALYLSHPFTLECVKWVMISFWPNIDAPIYLLAGLVAAHIVGVAVHRLVERPVLLLLRARLPSAAERSKSVDLRQRPTGSPIAVPDAKPFPSNIAITRSTHTDELSAGSAPETSTDTIGLVR